MVRVTLTVANKDLPDVLAALERRRETASVRTTEPTP